MSSEGKLVTKSPSSYHKATYTTSNFIATATMGLANRLLMSSLKSICFLLNMLTYASCKQQNSEQKIAFRVTNNSQDTIDFLTFSTQEEQGKTVPCTLQIGASTELKLNFKGVDRTDGGYKMKYKFSQSNDTLLNEFGYYTYGSPIEKEILLDVYADSISTKFVPFDAY